MTISRVLIANRGEIAVRIIRACQKLKLETVLAVSDADRDSLPARLAERTICIGPALASASYLNIGAILTAALATEADAIHPGYGFLSESPEFVEKCVEHGITFVGPKADQIRLMGHKIEARRAAQKCGLPTLPGSEKICSQVEAVRFAQEVGFPVMLKAAAGGGGRGMKVVSNTSDLPGVYLSASAEARAAFGDDSLYLERFISNARHIEVQVFGDSHGNVIHLGERDCSLQRRHQKIIEEAPAPKITGGFRDKIQAAAVPLAQSIRYENAGTVEFIVDQDEGKFYFLEMNTRIQVEHPVTEMITGIDLVREQFRVADGYDLSLSQSDVTFLGHSIECRINAEVPLEGFRPDPGLIVDWRQPQGPDVRMDTHCHTGYIVPMFYDSMLAKLIVKGTDRGDTLEKMREALDQFLVTGIKSTLPFLRYVLNHSSFTSEEVNTGLVDRLILEMSSQAL